MPAEPPPPTPKPRTAPRLNDLDWRLDRLTLCAEDFHHLDPPADRHHRLWWAQPPRPALILGSTQPESMLDRARAEGDGIEVTRRRSGGGIVFVDPATDCWIDALVPRGSPLWNDDVGRAFDWLGAVWADVIDQYLKPTPTERPIAQPGPQPSPRRATGQVRRPHRPAWCFADLGQGEVAVDGFKIVGLSQRRNRDWIRLQGLALGSWPAPRLARYLAPPGRRIELPFDRWDPIDVKAGPPPGTRLPAPEHLGDALLKRLIG